MAEKKQSKRPSVVGRKVKIAKEPAAAAAPSQVGGASSVGSAAVGAPAASQPQAAPRPAKSRPSVAGKAVAAPASAKVPASAPAQAPAPKSSSSVESGSVSGKTGTPRVSKKGGKRRISRRFVAIAASVVAVLLVATAVLSWNQWLRYDDAADMQGTWLVQGTGATVTITGSEVQLTSDVSYTYELDTFRKTIAFGFAKYTGGGSYAFSPERDVLTITEDESDAEGGKAVTILVKRS